MLLSLPYELGACQPEPPGIAGNRRESGEFLRDAKRLRLRGLWRLRGLFFQDITPNPCKGRGEVYDKPHGASESAPHP